MSAATAPQATLAEGWPTAPWTMHTCRKSPKKNSKQLRKSDNKALLQLRKPKKQLNLLGKKQPENRKKP